MNVSKNLGGFLMALGAFGAYVVWGPLLKFLYTLAPQNDWAGVVKLAMTVLIGYAGGIALPLGLLIAGWLIFFDKI